MKTKDQVLNEVSRWGHRFFELPIDHFSCSVSAESPWLRLADQGKQIYHNWHLSFSASDVLLATFAISKVSHRTRSHRRPNSHQVENKLQKTRSNFWQIIAQELSIPRRQKSSPNLIYPHSVRHLHVHMPPARGISWHFDGSIGTLHLFIRCMRNWRIYGLYGFPSSAFLRPSRL